MSTIFTHIYNDGYSLGAMDCGHTPTAVAAGTYAYENYYYYSFLYACRKRWSLGDTWELKANLNALGLNPKYYAEKDIEKAIEQMSSLVAEDKPVLMFVPYNKLFYSVNYNTVSNAMHGTLFVGYEDQRDSFMLMDSVQMWGANQDFDGKAETFIRLPLSRKVFTVMLEDMAEAYIDENGEHYIPFYAIECIGESKVSCWSDLFGEIIKIKPRSRFCEIIDCFNSYKEKAKQNADFPSRLRQQLNGTTEIVNKSVFRFLDEKIYTDHFKKYAEDEMKRYIGISDRISLWLLKSLISPMKTDGEKLEEKKKIIEESEICFYKLISDIYNLPNKDDRIGLTNLTSYSEASADSGYPLVIHPGKEDATVIWDSMNEPTEHCMTVDLKSERYVRTILIRHSGLTGLTTSDFELLASADGETYTVISERNNNTETETKFSFENLKCRYIRLHINKTNNYECNTKIRGFQIFGKQCV